MRALVYDGSGISLGEAPDPVTDPADALVEVRAVSLNRGEVRRLPERAAGTVPGWDVAGVIARAAADGSGPAEGTRIAGLVRDGGWAELASVPTAHLAVLPATVSFEAASTLPIAGITAVRALEVGGALLGRRVLVTGAAGGVGRFAIQLAHRAGAHVTGVIGSPERGEGLRELGADQLVTELAPDGDPFDLLLESVGGASLAAALTRVAPRGTIVSFGNSAQGEPTTFDVARFYSRAGARLYALRVWDELARHRSGARDLALLVGELAAGRLDSRISLTADWHQPQAALDALIGRRVAGKAVLTIT